MLIFKPLAGTATSPHTRPLCYLLVIDDVRILLDCGSFPPGTSSDIAEAYHAALQKEASNIDLVLFSHGDLSHIGLYPYAHAKWKLTAPAYASIPVQAMGRMAIQEEFEDINAEEKLDKADDVAQDGDHPASKYLASRMEIMEALDAISTLRYSEPIQLSGKTQGITITPYSAGHTIGGTIWKIRSPSSGTIVYAVNMNHTKERHLDGTIMLRPGGGGVFEGLARPDLLITDADRTLVTTPRRKDRDTAFLDLLSLTLKTSHSVFIPCDASTRILELLVLLDQYWTYQKMTAPICLVSKTGQEMLAYVRSMVEWMGGTVSKDDGNPELDISKTGRKRRREDEEDEAAVGPASLRFRNVHFFPDAASLTADKVWDTPKIILSVPYNMAYGPSRKLFTTFAQDPGNLVLLTCVAEPTTLAHDIMGMWDDRQSDADKWGKGKVGEVVRVGETVAIKINSRIPLSGQELEDFLTKEREQVAKEREAAQRAALAQSQRLLEADEAESEEDSDGDDDDDEDAVERTLQGDDMEVDAGAHRAKPGKMATQDWSLDDGDANRMLSFDIYLKGNVSKATSFFKSASGASQRYRMFPYIEKGGGGAKRRVDEYGETLDVAMWLRRGKALDEDAEPEELKEARRKKKEEEEAKKHPKEPPSKFVTEEVQVNFACQLAYIDLEGLNDGRAVKTIIPQVNPRRMILVHSSKPATDALVESCASIRSVTQQIYAPSFGEEVTIGQHINTYSIALADALMASLKMSKFEDSEMAFVTGRVASHGAAAMPVLEPLAGSTSAASQPTPKAEEEAPRISVDATDPNKKAVNVKAVPLPKSTMIGDLKLNVLRQRLTALGLSAEFAGEGLLVCSGGGVGELEQTVAIRKTGRGKISIEGSTGDVYFAVRDEVYSLHAVVSQA